VQPRLERPPAVLLPWAAALEPGDLHLELPWCWLLPRALAKGGEAVVEYAPGRLREPVGPREDVREGPVPEVIGDPGRRRERVQPHLGLVAQGEHPEVSLQDVS